MILPQVDNRYHVMDAGVRRDGEPVRQRGDFFDDPQGGADGSQFVVVGLRGLVPGTKTVEPQYHEVPDLEFLVLPPGVEVFLLFPLRNSDGVTRLIASIL